MSKFNGARLVSGLGPVRSRRSDKTTHEGAPGYGRDARSELFLLAVANMVSEPTFYESAADRDDRFRTLVRQLAVTDFDWLARMVAWLRTDANMRSASLVAAAEAVHARLEVAEHGGNRALVDAVLQRADEPGELLAYWTSRYGRALPMPVKRGVADAARRLYDERALLKYDSEAKVFRFADVLDLTHPAPVAPWQGELFRHALDLRHHRENGLPESLAVLRARAELVAVPVDQRRALLDAPGAAERLRAAGMTWEALAGWLQGPLDAGAWESQIPSMGYFAQLRNLRNFDQAGVTDGVAEQVARRIADPAGVARSRLFPFRFLAAYQAAPSLRWGHALEQALNASLANVPALRGRTLVLVDRSGSMFGTFSGRSELTNADAAALFGTAVARRAEHADLIQFGTDSSRIPLRAGESVLRVVERFGGLGGTNTADAVRKWYRNHDRVVIVTDEQAWGGYHGADPLDAVPAHVPTYTWNLVGYQHGHGESGSANRHTFAGLTDAAFRMIPLLERGRATDWPF